MSRIGKIARLPHDIREQLNRRLQDGHHELEADERQVYDEKMARRDARIAELEALLRKHGGLQACDCACLKCDRIWRSTAPGSEEHCPWCRIAELEALLREARDRLDGCIGPNGEAPLKSWPVTRAALRVARDAIYAALKNELPTV